MRSEKSRGELKALLKAMDEAGLASGTVVTYEGEEEITEGGKTIRLVPAYQYLYGSAD